MNVATSSKEPGMTQRIPENLSPAAGEAFLGRSTAGQFRIRTGT
jgi:hypothetical protein